MTPRKKVSPGTTEAVEKAPLGRRGVQMEAKFDAKWRFGVPRIDFVLKLPNLSLTQYLPRFKQVHYFLKSEIFHTIHLLHLTIPAGSQIHRNTLLIPHDAAQLSCQGTIVTENCPQNGSHFGRWGY